MKLRFILKTTLGLLAILACAMTLPLPAAAQAPVATSYKESKDVIANPERGLYFNEGVDGIDHSTGCWANYKPENRLTLEKLKSIRARGLSLLYLQYDLGAYREADKIESRFIDCIKTDFNNVRAAGLKVILRFAYNPRHRVNGAKSEVYEDYQENVEASGECNKIGDEANLCEAKLEKIKRQLQDEEFAGLIRGNSDVIALWQAGFLGKYGEWYYTRDDVGLKGKQNFHASAEIIKLMLDILPAPGIVQVRTPRYKCEMIKALTNTSSCEANGLTGDAKVFEERIGFYNDCFYDKDKSDGETYCNPVVEKCSDGTVVKYWRDYLAMKGMKYPVGGETCNTVRSGSWKTVLEEFSRFHWSFFSEARLNETKVGWTSISKRSDLQKYLGYRLYLKESVFKQSVMAGEKLTVQLTFSNSGWAAPFHPRDSELILREECQDLAKCGKTVPLGIKTVPLSIDIRDWLPNTSQVTTAIIDTQGLAEGSYELLLNFPDKAKDKLKLPEYYSIRLANQKDGNFHWEASTGYNRFGQVKLTK
ncbi:MAG: DUF4832 domain-containing protein [Pyrinomonadaceae bacterium]